MSAALVITEEAVAATQVRPLDALKTYRYLRLGMIGAVVLLGTSIGVESFKASNAATGAQWCLQRSISAYYFTPVRAVFVGCMFLVGLALIAYKGRELWEDFFLNVAGMLAPVVAVVPTTAVGACYSVEPESQPLAGGTLASWVRANVDNNMNALFIVGVIAVLVGSIIWRKNLRDPKRRDEIHPHAMEILLGTLLILVAVMLVKKFVPDLFFAHAHLASAVLLFVFLGLAILANIRVHTKEGEHVWVRLYRGVLAYMVFGIPVSLIFGAHQVFVLEAWEIAAFATYWILQTKENWDEETVVIHSPAEPGVQLPPQ